jgi:hypothetical protein
MLDVIKVCATIILVGISAGLASGAGIVILMGALALAERLF